MGVLALGRCIHAPFGVGMASTDQTSQGENKRRSTKGGAQTRQRQAKTASQAKSSNQAAQRSGQSRKFRLQAEESISAGIARVVNGQIERAAEHLNGRRGESPDEAIHEARKSFKRIRATLRLARSGLGTEAFRRENSRYRDLGRELAGARDADVALATLDSLGERFADELGPKGVPGLRKRLQQEQRSRRSELLAASGSQKKVVESLTSAQSELEELAIADSPAALIGGLRRTYRAGRKDLARVRKDPEPQNLHQWRKRVKDLWHQLEILEFVWPKPMRALAAETHRLAELLGEDHDLVILAQKTRDLDGDSDTATLHRLVAERRGELQREALELGARLFTESPSAFAARVDRYLRSAVVKGDKAEV